MTTKFSLPALEVYLSDIFGEQAQEGKEQKTGLLLENIPQSTKHYLKRLGAKLQEEHKAYIDSRNALVTKYGEEVEQPDGNKITKVKDDNMQEFLKEVNELMQSSIEIDHTVMTEESFFDSNGKVFTSKNYYNLLDVLVYDKQLEAK